jgi:hypothetical protein
MAMVQRPRAFETILFGGLTAGVLDAFDATLFFGALGASPTRIAQHVASGLLGPASFDGGGVTIALGVVLHFTVAICIAATFWLVSQRIAALSTHPVLGGLGFGAAAYFVMGHVVVPLSRASSARGFSWPVFANGVIGHAVLIGLPIALWAARSIGRARAPAGRPATAPVGFR